LANFSLVATFQATAVALAVSGLLAIPLQTATIRCGTAFAAP
jgi:hypothetical protein